MARIHHPTGALGAIHLDPDLVFELTDDEHGREHKVRGLLGLDRGVQATTAAERVELRLRRLAVFLVVTLVPLLLEGPLRSFIVSLAEHFVSWADELMDESSESKAA